MSDEEKRLEFEQDAAQEPARESGSAEMGGDGSGASVGKGNESSDSAAIDAAAIDAAASDAAASDAASRDKAPPEAIAQGSAAAEGNGPHAGHEGGQSSPSDRAQGSHESDGHAHDDHAHDGQGSHGHGGHGEHFAHTTPKSLLIGVLVALILLTILTVGVTAIDLGSQGNFVVAMVIATVKAALVMAYFMHMVWDSKFNVVAFTSSFLFVLLFLAMSVVDRSEYQQDVNVWEADQKLQASE